MKRALFAGLVFLTAISFLSLGAPDYTIVPWPYGAVVWIGAPSQDAQTMVDYAIRAVQNVFRFWGIHPPSPAANWAHPVQTSSQAWYRGTMEQIQSPSVPITDFIGRDYSLIRGTPVPEPGSDELLILPAPSWEREKIPPLIIGAYPDRESMNAACGDYSFIGTYGPPLSFRALMLEKPTGPSASLIPILASGSDIILPRTDDWRSILDHEIAHWLTSLVCRYEGTDFGSLPPVMAEGIADYTAYSLSGAGRRWENVAAAWVQAGGKLDSVPPPLWYDVGTSVVDYLVERKGKDVLLYSLPEFAADWARQAAAITPGWRASLHNEKLTDGDRALYEATLERLDLCAWMLDPVLPPEAQALLDKLYTGKGAPSDIDAFWKLISTAPPPPSHDAWARLARREDTFRIVQYRDGDRNGERMARARVEINLRKYREGGDWQGYYHWFITGLRKVIAAWGDTKGG